MNMCGTSLNTNVKHIKETFIQQILQKLSLFKISTTLILPNNLKKILKDNKKSHSKKPNFLKNKNAIKK